MSPPNSYAYRRSLSTLSWINDWPLYISVDVKNAYEIVDVTTLESIFALIHIHSDLISLDIQIPIRRKLILAEETTAVYNDTLQSCILSPVLFSIYTQFLHSRVSNGINIFQYADDILVISAGLWKWGLHCYLDSGLMNL